MSEGLAPLLKRIKLCSREQSETYETLSEADQAAFQAFFAGYVRNVLHITKPAMVIDLGGALAQLFEMGHDYRDMYGPLWGRPQQEQP